MAIGADHRLSPDPSCLLLLPPRAGVPPSNPRQCRVEEGDRYAGGYGLALTPNGRFAYLVSTSHHAVGAGIVELSRSAEGSLSVLPGCVSGSGDRGEFGTGGCETTLPAAESGTQYLSIRQLALTLDGNGLIVRGDDSQGGQSKTFLVRFAIGADGTLTRSRSATACVNSTGRMGCAASTAIRELESSMAVAGNRVYIGMADQVGGPQSDQLASTILGFTLSGDGGLSLPAGRSGCAANRTRQAERIKKVGACSLGREAMRHPADVLTAPGGNALYVVGILGSDSRGIALFKLGAGGAPSPVSGPSGCYVDTTIYTKEKTRCNTSFTPGTLANAEYALALAPDGRSVYVLEQVRDFDIDRLTLLQVAR